LTATVEVICIGNELLIGKIENTNVSWLAKQITQLGANLTRVTVIQDITQEIASTINESAQRKPQFIITTGGLGPTFDDKTLQGLAAALNRKLEVNPDALTFVKKRITEYAKKRGCLTEIELTPPRIKIATLPEETIVINNPVGAAPAVRANVKEAILFALPGVPHEMEAIFNESIAPLIREAVGEGVFCERSLFLEDIFESKLTPLIDQVMINNEGVYVKSHPLNSEGKAHMELHLTMVAKQNCNPKGKLEKAALELADLITANGGVVKQ
jgi:molybdenum cofactor synthesis domain-containing protein